MKKYLLIYGTQNYTNAINSLIKSSQDFFDDHYDLQILIKIFIIKIKIF